VRRPSAYSLVELLIVVAILSAMAFVAVPRLQFGAIHQKQAEVAASRILSALRQARSLAILNAVDHPDGYALRLAKSGGATTFDIVDAATSAVVESQSLDRSVSASGGTLFTFTPLGALKAGSDTSLSVSAQGATRTVTIVAATGMAQCQESP
jgi:prepilin-type N-terminal cleavage/methylation domain-containing protein